MATAFKLAYSLAVAILFILFVILGIRTVYPEPESPYDQYRYPTALSGPPSEAELRDYDDEHADYARNVLIASTVLGALAVACGLYLFRRAEPVALGLMLGGLGVVIYGWAQAGDEFEEMGTTVPFLAVGLGLAAALAAGYYFLQVRGAPPGEQGAG